MSDPPLPRMTPAAVDYRRFALESLDMLCVAGPDGFVHWANDSWTRILGWSIEELTSRPFLDFVHPDDVARTIQEAKQVDAGLPAARFANRYRCKDGTYRWLEWSTRIGADRLFYCNVRDVTATREIMRAAHRQLHLLTLAEEMAGVGHWRVVVGDDSIQWSREVYRIHGRDPATFVPSLASALDAYHPDDRPTIEAAVKRALDAKAGYQLELRIIRADGHLRFIRTKGRCEVDSVTGEVKAIYGMFQDITEERRRSEELERARIAAQEANVAKSRFLANMSHEIRTPMNGIVGITSLLLGIPLSEEQRSYVATIQESATALGVIIDDILDFSKIEAGELAMETTRFDLATMIDGVASLFTPAATKKGLRLRTEREGRSTWEVASDPVRLRQVVTNLVSNALKFTAQGEITIRVSGDDDRVRFAIEDSGIGIEPDVQARIFRPFVQADATTTRRFGGTGLGLAIASEIVTRLGGNLTVASTPGRGSTFSFSLPLATERARRESVIVRTGTITLETASPAGARVLVAEDNAVNQMVIRGLLRQLGCNVTVVANGREVIAACNDGAFDLVLMDCQMPEVDGFEATRDLRRRGLTVPIVALTASALDDDRTACFAAGMSDFLAKPITKAALADVVTRWTESLAPAASVANGTG